jgi:hypothetical protein
MIQDPVATKRQKVSESEPLPPAPEFEEVFKAALKDDEEGMS